MFIPYKQFESSDCGPTCLKMIIRHYGKQISIQQLRVLCNTDREGSSINSIISAAKKVGLNALAVKCQIDDKTINTNYPDIHELSFPLIAHWNGNHFVVIYKIHKNTFFIADPARGKVSIHLNELKSFLFNNSDFGKVVLFEPNTDFHNNDNPYFKNQLLVNKYNFIKKYVVTNRKGIFALILLVFLQLILQGTTPFLTQISFDSGILQKNLNILLSVFIVQIIIFLFSSALNYFNSIISNRISQSINVSLSNDFIHKLFKIPLTYYQQKKTSDFIQKSFDLNKIESFITYNFASIILSFVGILILSGIAIYYNIAIFLIVVVYSTLNFMWTIYSLRKKKELDYEKFDINVNTHRYLTEIIEGITEIKISNSEKTKIDTLIVNQKNYFANNLKFIKLSQILVIGGGLISNMGNGFVIFYSAYLTLDQTITIGEMAAIQLVVNQLVSKINGVTGSVSTIKDTKFSMERVLETQMLNEEKYGDKPVKPNYNIKFDNVSFSYTDISDSVVDNINFEIEANKTTAIVGLSGSGKTTIMKLALGLYSPKQGKILLNEIPIAEYNMEKWRQQCGVVMQEGYIFTDTIKNNIILSGNNYDDNKYINALKQAVIYDFIDNLPIKHETLIGKEGLSLSSGQRQRILIARMIYKNPDFIFMDEATNSLDSETEHIVLNNITKNFANKTCLIIAHRLNTVKNADKVIVLHNGKIVESGCHDQLICNRAYYYNLVKEQLL